MLALQVSAVLVDPPHATRPRREERALASFHPLILALCRATRRFPAADPLELGHGLRDTALAAAEAVLGACQLRALPLAFASALVEAVRRLRELGCCLEVSRRLGYLDEPTAAELLALHARAAFTVSTLAHEARQPPAARCDGGRPLRSRTLLGTIKPMKTMTASKARANLYRLVEETVQSREPVQITGKKGSAVLISTQDWNALQETVYLLSIPGMRESIRKGLATPIEACSENPGW